MKIIFISYCVLRISFFCVAQTATTWNGKQCAVVLTYDDGLNVDLTNAIPALDSVGLKGTLYISDCVSGWNAQIQACKQAAIKRHELANHTLWHACEGGRAGRDVVNSHHHRY